MKNLQKVGGIAALYAGAAYMVGMLGFGLIKHGDKSVTKRHPLHREAG